MLFEDFRADPEKHPLKTPSGKIEIGSETIAKLGYDDCPPHPVWIAPAEWLGSAQAKRFPLHLVTNQPATRLHSQMDPGSFSAGGKVAGREPIRINTADAARRNIRDGDVVRVFNDRGACLAGAVVDDGVVPQVAVMATGAWLDQSDGEDGAARQSQRAHARHRHLAADAGLRRAHRAGRDRTLGRAGAAGARLYAAEARQG